MIAVRVMRRNMPVIGPVVETKFSSRMADVAEGLAVNPVDATQSA
jgi:hypothetical protein